MLRAAEALARAAVAELTSTQVGSVGASPAAGEPALATQPTAQSPASGSEVNHSSGKPKRKRKKKQNQRAKMEKANGMQVASLVASTDEIAHQAGPFQG